MSDNDKTDPQDENTLIALRRAKLAELRARGPAFPNDFRRNVVAGELHADTAPRTPPRSNPIHDA